MLFLGIANGAGDEVEEVPLPEIGPAVEREQIDGSGAETVGADGSEHAHPGGIPTVPDVVAIAVLFAGPVEFGGGACKTVENGGVAGGHFFENAANESVAWGRGNLQIDEGRGNSQGSMIGVVNGRGRERAGDEDEGDEGEPKNKPTIHKLPS